MPLIKTELLIPRVLCIGTKEGEPNDTSRDYISGNIITVGDYLSNSDFLSMKATAEYLGGLVEKFPHLFKPLPWWYGRTVEELPDYVKQTGMEDSAGNPVQDVVMKVKKHHSAGNGEWRDDSINIFCADSYLTGTPGSFTYAGWEPADESDYQEYQKQKQ